MTALFKWSLRSLGEMKDIHPDLRKVCNLALKYSTTDFIVTDGKRTLAEQKKHVASGASKTLKSRHLHGLAVDVAPLVAGKVRWEAAYFRPIAEAFRQASRELGIPIEWGGDWKTFKDMPHFELRKKEYPDP